MGGGSAALGRVAGPKTILSAALYAMPMTSGREVLHRPILRLRAAFSKVRMVSRKAFHRAGRKVLVKPFVVLAARCLGPGPLRLEMVKLAHDLADRNESFASLSGRLQALPTYEGPTQRAA